MAGVLERHGQWFCSERCAQEYALGQARGVRGGLLRRLRDPWVWVPIAGTLLALIDRVWVVAEPVSAVYRGYLQVVGLPLLAGLILGGLIDHFVPRE
jgi:hypothetical protein